MTSTSAARWRKSTSRPGATVSRLGLRGRRSILGGLRAVGLLVGDPPRRILGLVGARGLQGGEKAGDAEAQSTLAGLYLQGIGVDRDPAMAALWYERSAEQGDPEDQTNFALLQANGAFGDADFMMAEQWLLRAAAGAETKISRALLPAGLARAGRARAHRDAEHCFRDSRHARIVSGPLAGRNPPRGGTLSRPRDPIGSIPGDVRVSADETGNPTLPLAPGPALPAELAERIGPYRIVRALGEGGAALVGRVAGGRHQHDVAGVHQALVHVEDRLLRADRRAHLRGRVERDREAAGLRAASLESHIAQLVEQLGHGGRWPIGGQPPQAPEAMRRLEIPEDMRKQHRFAELPARCHQCRDWMVGSAERMRAPRDGGAGA